MRFRKHVIQYGDTMQSIAQYYYNNVGAWIELIEHNNLKYPYIVDDESVKNKDPERLVTIGDTIIIPTEENLSDVVLQDISSKDRDALLELSFGRDLNITRDEGYFNERGTSDEILGFTGTSGDLDTVTGIGNIKQQLQTRLLTPRGSLMLHPDYGSDLHELFGKNIPEQAVLIEMEVCRTLLSDGRVQSANNVDWNIEGNEYSGTYSVELKSVEESIRLVLEADETGVFALFE